MIITMIMEALDPEVKGLVARSGQDLVGPVGQDLGVDLGTLLRRLDQRHTEIFSLLDDLQLFLNVSIFKCNNYLVKLIFKMVWLSTALS